MSAADGEKRSWGKRLRTTGSLAPQIRISEKERISPIFDEIFSWIGNVGYLVIGRGNGLELTYVRTSIEAFSAVSSVK